LAPKLNLLHPARRTSLAGGSSAQPWLGQGCEPVSTGGISPADL